MPNPYKKKNKMIIVTLGPSTYNKETLKKIEDRKPDFVRINLSHTPIDKIEETIVYVTENISVPLMIDTEGSQVRTGNLNKDSLSFDTYDTIKVHKNPVVCNKERIYLRPERAVEKLEVGDLIFVDFDTLILRTDSVNELETEGYVTCTVLSGGKMGNNKAVTIDNQKFVLPPISKKDEKAIELAKKHSLHLYSMSFVDSAKDVLELRKRHPNSKIIAKIETEKGVNNLDEILDISDGILIDRGDLSREIPLEKIAFAQKIITSKANEKNVPVFVATNLLDTMMSSLRPSRAEINDIVNTLLDGADGLVLAAETAIGNNPVPTIDFMKNLMRETSEIQKSNIIEKTKSLGTKSMDVLNYITNPTIGSNLILPHGGYLVNRERKSYLDEQEEKRMGNLKVSEETIMDAEQIAIGTFSPLKGFLCKDDFYSVLDTMRLKSGIIWPIPIIIQIDAKTSRELSNHKQIILKNQEGKNIAILQNEDIFKINKDEVVKKWFGTNDKNHPGVKRIFSEGDYVIGGRIELLERTTNEYKHYELTPAQARKIFESLNWKKIIGFHTRNVIHRSHEFIQLHSMDTYRADGLFIHPVIGKKKKGDFRTKHIIENYELMLKEHYPKNKIVFGTFATFSRYCGPREALFTAICRQNYGCSHFIVGRDHTGVKNYYSPYASQEIFDNFPDLEIKPIKCTEVFYCEKCNSYQNQETCFHDNQFHKYISGTLMRQMIQEDKKIPEWLMRPTISTNLTQKIKKGEKIFID